jgi:hypothetical protein
MASGPNERPTGKWVAGWSAAATTALLAPMFVIETGDGPASAIGLVLGGICLLVVPMVLAHRTRPLLRYAPAVIALAIAGAWAGYGVAVQHEPRLGRIFLVIGGVFAAFTVVSVAMTVADERHWIVKTPARRRLTRGMLAALVVWQAAQLALDIKTPAVTTALTIGMIATALWPARRAADQSQAAGSQL